MDYWFGKGCKFQCCQWEDTEETGGPDYKECEPVLIFCNHEKNLEDTEGNCRPFTCPLNFRKFLSNKSRRWLKFAEHVMFHIENYVIPQYGDDGHDPHSDYTVQDFFKAIERYIKRYGRNSRPGQQALDFFKSAHIVQEAFDKYKEDETSESDKAQL
jgi:hypothetical protein